MFYFMAKVGTFPAKKIKSLFTSKIKQLIFLVSTYVYEIRVNIMICDTYVITTLLVQLVYRISTTQVCQNVWDLQLLAILSNYALFQ